MTNRDKKDSIRSRMADTGESFNVARRKVEAAGQAPGGENSYRLIEVEVGTDAKFPDRPLNPRHVETFWGRWIIAPDPERLYPLPSGSLRSACYGVAQTRQGRIAVYMRVVYQAKGYPSVAEESIAEDAPIWQSLAKGGSSTSTRWPMLISCRKTSTSRRLPRWSFTATSEPSRPPGSSRALGWTDGVGQAVPGHLRLRGT